MAVELKIPEETYARLAAGAAARGLSVDALAEECLRDALAELGYGFDASEAEDSEKDT